MYQRLDHILQLQKIYLIELQQMHKNSELYSLNMKLLADKVKENWQDTNYFLSEYDSFVTNITNIMEFTRKYNLQLRLHNIKLTEMHSIFPKIDQKANGDDKSNKLETPPHLYPAEEYDQNSESDEVFRYPKIILKDAYKENEVLNGRVTYVSNFEDLSFYIIDKSSDNLEMINKLSTSLELRQYHELPSTQEVFGCLLDKYIFRAVQSTSKLFDSEINEEIVPCYLLDTGETLPLKADNIIYRLTYDQTSIPALALPCKLYTSNKNPFVEQTQYADKLRALQYDECCQLQIIKIDENMLHVEIMEHTENNADENISLENLSLDAKPKNSDQKALNEEELELLYEEPLNTSNAMKAVMGYDPQDDKRICRFFDPKTGGCFKGANCKLEHTLREPDGWTKDVLPTSSVIDNRHPQIIFPEDSIINITPTYIGRLDRFYAQINNPQHINTPLVWNDEDIPSWKQLKKAPHMFELVLCRYVDGLWYRAKIMSHDDDYKMFKVLYVDYGNSQLIHLRNLASIDMGMAQLPFQAILCRIDGVSEKSFLLQEKLKIGIEVMCAMILNKSMNVKVKSHIDDLFITFENKDEYPLPDLLVEKGFLAFNGK